MLLQTEISCGSEIQFWSDNNQMVLIAYNSFIIRGIITCCCYRPHINNNNIKEVFSDKNVPMMVMMIVMMLMFMVMTLLMIMMSMMVIKEIMFILIVLMMVK